MSFSKVLMLLFFLGAQSFAGTPVAGGSCDAKFLAELMDPAYKIMEAVKSAIAACDAACAPDQYTNPTIPTLNTAFDTVRLELISCENAKCSDESVQAVKAAIAALSKIADGILKDANAKAADCKKRNGCVNGVVPGTGLHCLIGVGP